MKTPNILLITADQFRWDCLGCAGNPAIRTPHLDALAARGVRFDNAFTPDPICVPARACIMTGNYPQVCTGNKANNGRIRDGQPLLTETLKRVGYRTATIGKLHFVPYAPPGQPRLLHGFEHAELMESGRILRQYDPEGRARGIEDYFDFLHDAGWHGYTRAHGVGNNDVRPCASPLPPELYVDHWIADRTIAALDRHARATPEAPFCIWMSSPKPHSPYDPPRPWDALYDPRALPPPFGPRERVREKAAIIEGQGIAHGTPSLSPEAWQTIRAHYYGNISFLDAQIGRVLAHLDATGARDNTLILFTADHGDLLGDFGSCFKGNHLNGSVRVPFLAAGPGIAAGMVSPALVGLQDILPTLAAAAGAPAPEAIQGCDLTPLLAGRAKAVREVYYATTGKAGGQSVMLTDGAWKYIYSEQGGCEEFYDQRNDPGETRNLARDPGHAAVCRDWRARAIAEARRLCDPIADGPDLPAAPFDRAAMTAWKASEHSLGWRWY